MAERLSPLTRRSSARAWGSFAWTEANAKAAAEIVARYPAGRQAFGGRSPSSTLPSARSAQMTGTQGWLPIPVIEFVARELDMPPVARHGGRQLLHHVQPRPGRQIPRPGVRHHAVHAARVGRRARRPATSAGLKKGHTTDDGLFTLTEVECLGACANAPMDRARTSRWKTTAASLRSTASSMRLFR